MRELHPKSFTDLRTKSAYTMYIKGLTSSTLCLSFIGQEVGLTKQSYMGLVYADTPSEKNVLASVEGLITPE